MGIQFFYGVFCVIYVLIVGVLAYWVAANCGDVLAILCLWFFAEMNSAAWMAKRERNVCWCSGAKRDGREEDCYGVKENNKKYIYLKKLKSAVFQ